MAYGTKNLRSKAGQGLKPALKAWGGSRRAWGRSVKQVDRRSRVREINTRSGSSHVRKEIYFIKEFWVQLLFQKREWNVPG